MPIYLAITVAALIVVAGALVLGHDVHLDHDLGHAGGGALSTRVLGAFALGFGAAGALATLSGLSRLSACAVAVGCGATLGAVTWGLVSLLAGEQSSMLVPTAELVGRVGVVVTDIRAGAPGEVLVGRGETSSTYLARSQHGAAIAKGLPVRVVRAEGSLLFVDEAARGAEHETTPNGGVHT